MLRNVQKPFAGLGLLCALLIGGAAPAAAQGKKIVLGIPGVPPIFANVPIYVAEKEGLYKKYGVNVEIRQFDNGTAAARGVIAGDVDMSLSPTPPLINQISNANVPLIAIYGLPNPDWILATTETGKTCKDVAGQPVGIDSIGGARSVALRSMLVGCPGVTIEQTNQVALGANTAPAMLAGQLKYGVLHLDDVAVLETQGKKVQTLLAMKQTNPTSHYLLYVVREDHLKANRDAYVRVVAALIDAARFMRDPKNADKVADAAAVTGHNKQIATAALQTFNAVNFWATEDDGMDRKKIEAVAALMKKIGGINADKEPVTFDKFVDQSVWKDANAMVK